MTKNDRIVMQMFPLVRRLILAFLLLAPFAGSAVTLGDARVKSFLNQPLDVEISIVGLDAGQNQDLRLRIANQQHFDRMGIAYNPVLADLNFDVVRSGGRWLVRARSDKPITEPFVEFPLQMSWPGGQMIRQYTFLLDPQRAIRPARASQTSRAIQPAAQPRTPTTTSSVKPGVDVYGPVKRGETLWPIAKKLKPRGITTRQMAMALLRANPQAFIGNNINRLRAGAVLTIPPLAFIEELDPQSARAQFAAQTTEHRHAAIATSPRSVPSTSPGKAPTPTEQTSESSEPATATTGQAEEDAAHLRIVTEQEKDATKPANEQNIKDQLLVTMEEIESNRLTTDAIQTRLARLESEITRMQQLVELKDAQIAALQSEVSTRDALEAAAAAAEPPVPSPATNDVVIETDNGATAAAPQSLGPKTAAVVAPTPVATIEAATPASTHRDVSRPWHEQYLWLIWVALALLGMTALILMFRRPQPLPGEPVAAELPAVSPTAAPEPHAAPAPPASDMRNAEADFRALSDANLPRRDDETEETADLPDVDLTQIAAGDDNQADNDQITDSVLAEMLEESRLVPETASKDAAGADFDDEDIASWIKELGNENEPGETRSANDEKLDDNDEIPSILTQLDDQMASSSSAEFPASPDIKLEPVDDQAPERIVEDDTFTMSLDLARAYLEIGDQEGARDMLQQALASTRDPEHRRQIEELLQQVSL